MFIVDMIPDTYRATVSQDVVDFAEGKSWGRGFRDKIKYVFCTTINHEMVKVNALDRLIVREYNWH